MLQMLQMLQIPFLRKHASNASKQLTRRGALTSAQCTPSWPCPDRACRSPRAEPASMAAPQKSSNQHV
eukprot:6178163-Pleurochrysis_carterae.AAC.3